MMVDRSQLAEEDHPADDVEPAERLRADARENRTRIVEVARELFASEGIDVPMKVIARRAEVGMATLYRRFPTRQDLLAEVFTEQFAECATILETALAEPDPWTGLCAGVRGLTAMQAADHGFGAAFVQELPNTAVVQEKLEQGMHGFRQLVDRAQASGQLRPDVTFADLTLVLMANSGVVGHAGHLAPAASERLVAHLLNSFGTNAVERTPLPASVEISLPRVVFPDSG
jgi:AcrR family transcriptional regulator